ncbi:MAG: hypothetical protein JNM94_10700 [Phycisphaerae bacterium]|nr:hypothetical protein [Phycisphaerae bacterium]
MRWGVFVVFLFVAIVLDTAFMQVFAVRGIWPAATPGLVTFVALYAARGQALWAAVLAGFLVDCTSTSLAFFDGVWPYQMIGPSILGFVVGTQLVLPLRSMVIRKNPLSLGLVTALFGLIAMLVTTAIFSARGWYAGTQPPWAGNSSALGHMGNEALRAIASGAFAVLLAIPFNTSLGAFGFAGTSPWSPRR